MLSSPETDLAAIQRLLIGALNCETVLVDAAAGVYEHRFLPQNLEISGIDFGQSDAWIEIEGTAEERILWIKAYGRLCSKKYRRILGRAIRQIRREHGRIEFTTVLRP